MTGEVSREGTGLGVRLLAGIMLRIEFYRLQFP